MVRPFGLRDAFFVHRLQKRGIWLAVDQVLVHAHSPLWIALTAPIPWHVNGMATYVMRTRRQGRRLDGFIQVRRRWDRAEADLVFISPDLGAERAPEIWHRLLQYCCRKAGDNGVQRVYASLPDDREELGVFREAGFSLYARENIFRLKLPTMSGFLTGDGIRAAYEVSDWQLRRLYMQHTPRLVQLAEGASGGDTLPPFLSDVDWAVVQNYVLVEDQEAYGFIQVLSGRDGHLLRLWGDTMDSERMSRLLGWGIAAAREQSMRPVYCAVRDYQGGLRALLEESGFEYVGQRARLVKHVVRPEQVPVGNAVPALEPRTEAITTVSGLGVGGNEGGVPLPLRVEEQQFVMIVKDAHPARQPEVPVAG
ncbi:MAG: hypothetical protein J7M34_04905 [Anaerolineae bacterium]|nr:hypothetical protein [Anaerolineae bacterium]